MTITDDQLDARLGSARMTSPALPAGAVSLLSRETRDRAHRRTVRTALGAGAAVTAFGVGAVAAGPAVAQDVRAFLAQSGWTSSGSEVVAGSQWIDTGAPDLAQYLGMVFPADLPLAPGQTRAEVIAAVVKQQTPGLMQSVGLVRALDREIRLGWLSEWIDAHAARNQARMDAAARVLVSSTEWPGFVATDGGGVIAADTAFMTAIAGGDAEAAQAFAQYDGAPVWDGVDRTALIDRILAGADGEK